MPITLQQAIIKYKGTLTAKDIAHIVKEILLSVQFIHSKDVSHLNLNPQNILILRNDPESFFKNVPIN